MTLAKLRVPLPLVASVKIDGDGFIRPDWNGNGAGSAATREVVRVGSEIRHFPLRWIYFRGRLRQLFSDSLFR